MPAFPEIPDGQRLVGGIEVHGQIDVQHSGKSQRHIAVAAEIEIDLEGVGQHHKKQFQGACLLHGQEHRRGGKGICQHGLLEQAEGELLHPGAERLLPETQTALLVKLGNEVLRRRNGAHDELGKVDHIQHIVEKAVPLPFPPGSIHQIGNLLEGKEADAQRQRKAGGINGRTQHQIHGLCREIQIFKNKQQAHMEGNSQPQQGLCSLFPALHPGKEQAVDPDADTQPQQALPAAVGIQAQGCPREEQVCRFPAQPGKEIVAANRQRQSRKNE